MKHANWHFYADDIVIDSHANLYKLLTFYNMPSMLSSVICLRWNFFVAP